VLGRVVLLIFLCLAGLVLEVLEIGWRGSSGIGEAAGSGEPPRAAETEAASWHRGEIQDRLNTLQKYRALGYFIPLISSEGLSGLHSGARNTLSLLMSDDELLSRAHAGGGGRGALSDVAIRRSMDFKALEAMSRWDGGGEAGGRVAGSGRIHRAPIGAPPPGFSSQRGFLSFPLTGEYESFSIGGSRWDAEAILHNGGLFVRAPRGEPIRAIFRGTVVFSEWFREYGRVMIIDHGDHYCSLIAHADQLLKGVSDTVEAGEVIATVGKTGAPKVPGLYFEIRHHGSPVDPLDWLKADTTSKE
jgi:murein DD-endopeptidase MepM/ murein hydrolase activator NlpD